MYYRIIFSYKFNTKNYFNTLDIVCTFASNFLNRKSMAAIGKIREKSGLLLVIIGLALAAFVMGDFLNGLGGGGPVIDQSKIALINDEKVATSEFSVRVSEQADLTLQQNQKSNMTSEESFQNVMDVWSIVKRETILNQQMVKLGLIQTIGDNPTAHITMEEYMDNINGAHPHSEIIRNFSDPNTKQFNPQAVANFLNYLERGVVSEDAKEREQAIQSQKQWRLLSKYIKNDIIVSKYNTLITKAYYMPKALAEVDFVDNAKMNKVAYFGAKYGLVTEEETSATDADYQSYYDKHTMDFEAKEEARRIDYIVWNVRPSTKDIQDLEEQIIEFGEELKTAMPQNIPYLVNRIGENRYDSTWIKPGSLSPFIDSAAFAAEVGVVLGPWPENSAYHVARVMGHSLRPDSMKASHILISYAGAYGATDSTTRTKIGARALADSILTEINNSPSKFAELAIMSDDPSVKTNNGEMEWFADGAMVPEFNQACLENNIGDLVITETAFGFHIIRIDDKKEATDKIRIAQIDLPITFSQETFNEVYSKASRFAAVNQNYEAFDTSSIGLNVIKGDFIAHLAKGVNGLNNSRDVVKWMFEEGVEKGTVSSVFDFEDKVAVAVITDIKPKGIQSLESVKEGIKFMVERDVKARVLTERMSKVTQLSQATEFSATIDTSMVSFATYSLQNYGPEQDVQGRMFNAETNKLVGPIVGDQAVYFFKVIEDGETPAMQDLKYTQQRSADLFGQRVSTSAYKTLEDNAEIEEFLYFFY